MGIERMIHEIDSKVRPVAFTGLLRALLVEDSEDDALLLLFELERLGYTTTYERVMTAEAMNEALARQHWDIILGLE